MNPRRLIVWGVLFAALVTYTLLFERPDDRAAAPVLPDTDEVRLVDVAADDITTVEIIRSGTRVALRRRLGGWTVTRPAGGSIDSEVAGSLIAAIADAVVIETIADQANDGAQYGLGDDATRVRLGVDGRDEPLELVLGDTAPSGLSLYATRSTDAPIVLVGNYLRFAVTTLFDNLATD